MRWKNVQPLNCRCFFLLMVCVMILSACSAPGATSVQPKPEDGEKRHMVSCLIEQFTSSQPETDSAWFQAFSEKYSLNISLTCIPTLDFVDRLSYLLSTEDLPSVIMTNNTLSQTGVLNRAVDAGMFWDLTPYIEDYPALTAYLGKDTLANSQINGKLFGLPRLRPLARNGIIYRKDWADRLGLDAPATIEDLYEMIRAFQIDDPDGNGLDDTRGLVDCWRGWSNIAWNGIQMLTTIYGGPNGWGLIDGAMTPDFLTDAWLSSLSFFRRLHHDGLLNDDFSVINAEQRRLAITTGNAGVEFCVIDDIISLSTLLRQTDSEAELAIMPLLARTAMDEPRLNSTTGNNGLLLFTKQGNHAIASEDEVRYLLSVFNDLCTTEGQDFLLNGLEGTHYTVDSDVKHAVLGANGGSLLSAQQGDFAMLLPMQSYERIGSETELVVAVNTEMAKRTHFLVQDASLGMLSDTYVVKKNKLDQIIFEASMRYILEEIDESGYRLACNEWREAGGNQVIQEYTEQYSALHN